MKTTTPNIAVLLFPGTNCELEALRACRRAKMKATLFRWNSKKLKLKDFDAFLLPGGFSYEDRGRSGVIAAKDPIIESIVKEAKKGKPVIGICNGAQILVEAGLIPGLNFRQLDMSLSSNERIKKGKIIGRGFFNDWIYIKSDVEENRTPFNRFSKNTIMRIPLAHAEGRFTTKDKSTLEQIIKDKQTLFRYCNKKGEFIDEFPINPNGTMYNLAGVCNKEGNVLSLMPHPERTLNGQAIFDSLADYLQNTNKLIKIIKKEAKSSFVKPKTLTIKPDITIEVKLIITDNEERTLENTIKRMDFKNIALQKKTYLGIHTKNKDNLIKIAEKIINSGEVINLNKEIPTVRIGDKVYKYDKEKGLKEKKEKIADFHKYLVLDRDNYDGKTIKNKLIPYFPNNEIKLIEKGKQWNIASKKGTNIDKLLKTFIFHNPHSMNIMEIQ